MVSGRYKNIEKNIGITYMRKTRELHVVRRRWENVRSFEDEIFQVAFFTMGHNVIALQCSECQSGEKFKTNAGKRLCCVAVLCCCAVLLCCGVCVVRHAEKTTLLMYMSASLFLLIFSRKTHYLP